MIVCFLFNLDYGFRSGGGIAELLPVISYGTETGHFIARVFFNILFHVMIALIMINLFFGIIVDTFADLRDKNSNIQYDMDNVCYICQITRDSALNQNMDFQKHIKLDHNIWNYVYFFTYLNISNPLSFTSLEKSVIDKMSEKDISWIPIIGGGGEEPE